MKKKQPKKKYSELTEEEKKQENQRKRQYVKKVNDGTIEINPNLRCYEITPFQIEAFYKVLEMLNKGLSVNKAVNEIKGFNISQFYNVIKRGGEHISKDYAHACEERQIYLFENMLDIAEDDSSDLYMNEKGAMVPNTAAVQRSKLKIDTIKWNLARMNPQKYSERMTLSGDANNPIKVQQITGMRVIDESNIIDVTPENE